jgi:quercetin dioxygenase-like cupin family protein
MHFISWSSVPTEELTPLIKRQYVSQPGVTVARFELSKNGIVNRHSHHNIQVTNVLSGALKFIFDDKSEKILRAGESVYLAANEPHEVHTMENSIVLDVFMPEREDWHAKKDSYFKPK